MRLTFSIVLLSIVSIVYSRTIFLSSQSNAVIFEVNDKDTVVKFQTTLGEGQIPIVLFKYEQLKQLKLPNFDYLLTNGKLNEYYQDGQFITIDKDAKDVYINTLNDESEITVKNQGVYCIHSPSISPFEFKVDIEEPGFYGRTDQMVFCLVNVFVNFLVQRLYSRKLKLFSYVRQLVMIKMAILLVSTIFLGLNFDIYNYCEILIKSIDDLFLIMFLMGYGTLKSSFPTKRTLLTMVAIIFPDVLNRVLDLKDDKLLLFINGQNYTIVKGILGNWKFDGLNFIQRLSKEYKIAKYSPFVAGLFALSKIFKMYIIIKYMRKTSSQLDPNSRKRFRLSIIIWLFLWSIITTGLSPDVSKYSSFNSIKDYSWVLQQYLTQNLRSTYITYSLDESHWWVLWMIWFGYEEQKKNI